MFVGVGKNGIIKRKDGVARGNHNELTKIGRIKIDCLEKEFGKIVTDEVIITDERKRHIEIRHPEDWDLFEQYGRECISAPDVIIKMRRARVPYSW